MGFNFEALHDKTVFMRGYDYIYDGNTTPYNQPKPSNPSKGYMVQSMIEQAKNVGKREIRCATYFDDW